ncbi:hypothetical protein KIP88_45520 [Bradyrhizobium sp. SRL28]|uniref:hypothetical protein n=1 Tax=Bradyrhizobium sp. SRL28 TaxID=2836178 RepID=UPI001BDEA5D0|nr:hypothetical protein [Bradyrhizobium sp. SRL28]MBT1517539.1 hypothetical protein [Bradyrhizobium sp. SRL28]
MIFNLLLGPYYGITVTIGRERSRANEVTIVSNSVKAILGHFDAPPNSCRTATLYSWPRDHAGRHCTIAAAALDFLKTQVLLAALAFARAKGTERRIENAGFRDRVFPRNYATGRDLVSGVLFVSMARREVSQPQIKLSFDLTLASPDMSPEH